MQSRYIFITGLVTSIGLILFLSLTTPLFADNPVGDINDPVIVVSNSATSMVDPQEVIAQAGPPVIEPADGPPYYIFLPLIHKPFFGWKTLSSGITDTIYGVSCPPDNSQTCVIVGPGFARYTNDGGKTWTSATTDLSAYILNEVSCISSTLCVAVGKRGTSDGVILVSKNGLAEWSVKNQGEVMYGVDCVGSFCLAVGGHSGVSWAIASLNSGEDWTGMDIGTPALYDVDCVANRTCWIVGDGARLFGTYSHPWSDFLGIGLIPKQDLLFPKDLYAIGCADSQYCVTVGIEGLIIKTVNGWKNKTFPASNVTVKLNGVSCPTATDCYAVGNGGIVLMSKDGGSTWTPETAISPTQNMHDVYCLPGTLSCYLVGAEGTIYYTNQLVNP